MYTDFFLQLSIPKEDTNIHVIVRFWAKIATCKYGYIYYEIPVSHCRLVLLHTRYMNEKDPLPNSTAW